MENTDNNSRQEVESDQSVFRKVRVEERLPTKSDYYFTDRGYIIFGTNTGKFQESKECYPKYWLEEIPLPTQSVKNEDSQLLLAFSLLEQAYLAGMKKRAEMSGLTFDFAAELHAKSNFIKWKNEAHILPALSIQSGLNKEEIIKWLEKKISQHQGSESNTGCAMYSAYTDCYQHILSLPTPVKGNSEKQDPDELNPYSHKAKWIKP